MGYIKRCKEKSCKHSGRLDETSRRSGRFAGGGRTLYAAAAHRLRASVSPGSRKVGGSNPPRRNNLIKQKEVKMFKFLLCTAFVIRHIYRRYGK